MKQLLSTVLLSGFFLISAAAQNSGVITYIENFKIEMKMDGIEGVDLAEMLPSNRTLEKKLTFKNAVSMYVDGENENVNQELSSDDGSIKIMMIQDDIENKIYTDHKRKTSIEQQGFMSKPFVVTSEVPNYKWKITNEKVKYIDYECIKATMINEEGKEVVAWFAPGIPASIGPATYGQLPGAILMLSKDGDKLEIKATNVELVDVDDIQEPTDGKKVTTDEFDKIVEDKMKEMSSEYGGRGRKQIRIRG